MLPFVRPLIPPVDAWAPHLRSSYDQRYFSNFGPAEDTLRALFDDRFGTPGRAAVTFSNATAGLTAALLACEVAGSVVCPSFTFPATVQAIQCAGLRPVFCDVAPQTWELCPDRLDELLARDKPGAVLHVRAFGHCRDLEPIRTRCAAAGIPLIVDAAAALGGWLREGSKVGHQGSIEVFSLHATKPFGIGEGGVAFCADHLAERLRAASNFGFGCGGVAGLNGKMSEFHAAVGLAVAEGFEADLRRRRIVVDRYKQELARLPVELPDDDVGLPPWQTMPVMLDEAVDAARIVARMVAMGVTTRRYYHPPLHLEARFAEAKIQMLPVTERLAARAICLPVYADMTDGEQETVIAAFGRSLVQEPASDTRPLASGARERH